MDTLILPAPLWRRLAAGIYDLLLLLGVLIPAVLLHLFVQRTIGLPATAAATRGLVFVVGFAFFGWFWTHGGQTLGMRAWRLQVRRLDGGPLSWRNAALRYAVACISLGAALLGFAWCLVDPRRRSWHDLAAGTEMVVLPRARP